jgi:3'-5' exoribonuclease 1
MNFIIFDLELTCWEGDMAGRHQEIIELAALKINSYGHTTSRFNRFVKPKWYPILSPFCSQLTTINQAQINLAKSFKEVSRDFIDWIDMDQEKYYLIAWGHNDLGFLKNECQNHNIDREWLENYVDLNNKYIKLRKLRDSISLLGALSLEGLEFEGTQHRAEDDAYNLSRLFIKYLADWDVYKY